MSRQTDEARYNASEWLESLETRQKWLEATSPARKEAGFNQRSVVEDTERALQHFRI
jgi:hypothetical protein